jgi:hypothetical protein
MIRMKTITATPAMCHHAEKLFSNASRRTPSKFSSRCRKMITEYVTKTACRVFGMPGNQRFSSDVVKIAAP